MVENEDGVLFDCGFQFVRLISLIMQHTCISGFVSVEVDAQNVQVCDEEQKFVVDFCLQFLKRSTEQEQFLKNVDLFCEIVAVITSNLQLFLDDNISSLLENIQICNLEYTQWQCKVLAGFLVKLILEFEKHQLQIKFKEKIKSIINQNEKTYEISINILQQLIPSIKVADQSQSDFCMEIINDIIKLHGKLFLDRILDQLGQKNCQVIDIICASIILQNDQNQIDVKIKKKIFKKLKSLLGEQSQLNSQIKFVPLVLAFKVFDEEFVANFLKKFQDFIIEYFIFCNKKVIQKQIDNLQTIMEVYGIQIVLELVKNEVIIVDDFVSKLLKNISQKNQEKILLQKKSLNLVPNQKDSQKYNYGVQNFNLLSEILLKFKEQISEDLIQQIIEQDSIHGFGIIPVSFVKQLGKKKKKKLFEVFLNGKWNQSSVLYMQQCVDVFSAEKSADLLQKVIQNRNFVQLRSERERERVELPQWLLDKQLPLKSVMEIVEQYIPISNIFAQHSSLFLEVMNLIEKLLYKVELDGHTLDNRNLMSQITQKMVEHYDGTLTAIDAKIWQILKKLCKTQNLDQGENELELQLMEQFVNKFMDMDLDVRRSALTICYYPIHQDLSNESLLNSTHSIYMHGYEPEFIVQLSISLLNKQNLWFQKFKQTDNQFLVNFVRQGWLSICIRQFSNSNIKIRQNAYEAMAKFQQILQRAVDDVKDKNQDEKFENQDVKSSKDQKVVSGNFYSRQQFENYFGGSQYFRLISTLQNSVTEKYEQIGGFLSMFYAESAIILAHPEHDIFKDVSWYFSKTSFSKSSGMPLLWKSLMNTASNHQAEIQDWILKLVCAGCQTAMDVNLLFKMHVIQFITTLYGVCSSRTQNVIIQILQKIICLGKVEDIQNHGLLQWIQIQHQGEKDGDKQDLFSKLLKLKIEEFQS